MENWIFISSPREYRMKDMLTQNGFVEYLQKNKVCVNDIVYIYSSYPIKRIEFKLIVERTDIPFDEMFDDLQYHLEKNPRRFIKGELFFRLRLLDISDSKDLSLSCLKQHGLNPKASMQSPFRISGELLDYIEAQFNDYQ